VEVANREALQQQLAKAGVSTGIHYPIPLHLQNAYASFNYPVGSFPVTEAAAPRILSLPMFPGLSAEQQRHTVSEVLQLTARSV
jgi:dTDP-4-amino-4,6-dideoxygalactose transaminase